MTGYLVKQVDTIFNIIQLFDTKIS